MSHQGAGEEPCPPPTRASFALCKSLLSIRQSRGSLTPFQTGPALSRSGSAHSGMSVAGIGRMRSRGRARQVSEALRVGAHRSAGPDAQGRGPVGVVPALLYTLAAVRAAPSGRTCDSVLQPLEGAVSTAALRPFEPPEGGALGFWAASRYPSSKLWCVCSSLVRGLWWHSLPSSEFPTARPRDVSVRVTRKGLGALVQAPRPGPGWVGWSGERREGVTEGMATR